MAGDSSVYGAGYFVGLHSRKQLFDGNRISLDYRQQRARRGVWHPAALLPIAHS